MKFPTKTTSFLLSLALTFVAAHPRAQPQSEEIDEQIKDSYNLTDSQFEYIESINEKIPDCLNTCMSLAFGGEEEVDGTQPLPLCALTDQSEEASEEDSENAYKCLYSDRIGMRNMVSCLVTKCGEPDAIEDGLEAFYAQAWYLSGQNVIYPTPPRILQELCLEEEDLENKKVPDALPDLEKGLGYEYAEDWPTPSVTTWVPPAFTGKPEEYVDVREPLTCAAALETSGPDASGEGEGGGSESTETGEGNAKPTPTAGGSGNGTGVGDDEGAAVGMAVPGAGMVLAVVGGMFVGGLGVLL